MSKETVSQPSYVEERGYNNSDGQSHNWASHGKEIKKKFKIVLNISVSRWLAAMPESQYLFLQGKMGKGVPEDYLYGYTWIFLYYVGLLN